MSRGGTPYFSPTRSTSSRSRANASRRDQLWRQPLPDVALEREHGLGLRAVALEDQLDRLADAGERGVDDVGLDAARDRFRAEAGEPFRERGPAAAILIGGREGAPHKRSGPDGRPEGLRCNQTGRGDIRSRPDDNWRGRDKERGGREDEDGRCREDDRSAASRGDRRAPSVRNRDQAFQNDRRAAL